MNATTTTTTKAFTDAHPLRRRREDAKLDTMTFRLDGITKAQIESDAKDRGMTRSSYVAMVIRRWFDRQRTPRAPLHSRGYHGPHIRLEAA